jgi:tetratricopeptide (TPR) repeat protein
MKKLNLLVMVLSVILFASCSANGTSVPVTYECCPSNDTLLENIESDIQKAFLRSIMSGDLEELGSIRDQLSDLNQEKPFRVIEYWMAFADYYSSITAMQHGDNDGAEYLIDRAIQTMKNMESKSSEDYALLAMAQGFGIQFKGMKAMFISRQINKNLEKAMTLDPNNLRAFYVAGSNDFYTPEQYGGGKMVEEYLTKALALEDQETPNPYLPSWGRDLAYETLINYYIKKEEWAKAKATFKEARELYPDNYMINQLAGELVDK